MAQSALTVTPPNPTPPTNMSVTGATGPNPPNFTKVNYANMFDMDTTVGPNLGRPEMTMPGVGVNPNPPPYFDDGAAGAVGLFAANTAALASGTGATSGGTEGTYPGAAAGAVPASTSVPHEAAGTETSVTGAGNITHTFPAPSPSQDTSKMYGVGPALTAPTAANPVFGSINALHASSLSPAVNPTLTSIATIASGGGNGTCTATGTGFTRQSVLWVNGIAYPTTYTSATTISCTAPKKATAGTLPVKVVTGGVVETATVNWTFT